MSMYFDPPYNDIEKKYPNCNAQKHVFLQYYYELMSTKHLTKNEIALELYHHYYPSEEISSSTFSDTVNPNKHYLNCRQVLAFCKVFNYDVNTIYRETEPISTSLQSKSLYTQDTFTFFTNCLQDKTKIDEVDMEFHAGSGWFMDKNLFAILMELIERQIFLKILLNDEKTIGKMAEALADPSQYLRFYGINPTIIKWNELQNKKNTKIEMRMSSFPLLHRVYIIKYHNGNKKSLITNYMYTPDRHFPRFSLTDADPLLTFFEREFNYIWEQSKI